jgi:opacity protein-like surface antigen
MKKLLCALAVLAAAVSTSAVAKDLKQNKQAVSGTQMTNSEMDRVTAGNPGNGNGGGNAWAYGLAPGPAWSINGGKADAAAGHNK